MKSSIFTSYLTLLTSAILYGFLVFGGKVMSLYGFSLIEILIIPSAIVVLVLLLTTRPELKKFYSVPLWVSLLYVVTVVVAQIGHFAPLFMGMSVSLTVLLLYTQPLWTLLISTAFLKTKFTKKDALLIFLTLSGLLFLLSPWKGFGFSLWGVVVALIGGISMSGWIVINGSFYAKKDLKPLSITFFTNIYQSIPFILAVPLLVHYFPEPSISHINYDRGFILLTAVFVYSISVLIAASCLFYKAARKINNIHLGLVLLLEPVIATCLDVVFLNTHLTWNIFVGGGLILMANGYLVLRSAQSEVKE